MHIFVLQWQILDVSVVQKLTLVHFDSISRQYSLTFHQLLMSKGEAEIPKLIAEMITEHYWVQRAFCKAFSYRSSNTWDVYLRCIPEMKRLALTSSNRVAPRRFTTPMAEIQKCLYLRIFLNIKETSSSLFWAESCKSPYFNSATLSWTMNPREWQRTCRLW